MDQFDKFKVSSTSYYLRIIARIRKVFITDATKSLLHAYALTSVKIQ